jgi:hypothetical protein
MASAFADRADLILRKQNGELCVKGSEVLSTPAQLWNVRTTLDIMAHQHTPHHREYDGPEHFPVERHNAGLIAAWAIGLVAVLSGIGLLASRLHS